MNEATDRGEVLLEIIHEDVSRRMNPNDEECFHCGGEGYTFDCFDGFCEDAEIGCEQCARPCVECKLHEAKIKRAVRIEVLKACDVDLAVAFAKSTGRWSEPLSSDEVLANIHAARVGCDAFTPEERAVSACWVEGLI